MVLLLLVSLVWAFSFGLTKGRLAGIDPAWVSALRLSLAFMVFAPFLKIKGTKPGEIGRWMLVGAFQFGAMYLALNASYHYLPAHVVALLTCVTPIWVLLLSGPREWPKPVRLWGAVALSVGAGVFLSFRSQGPGWTGTGVLLVQISNLCFALGQVWYRRWAGTSGLSDAQRFAWAYLGAILLTLPVAWAGASPTTLDLSGGQIGTLVYLGVLASGLCFFAWNVGAARVSAGVLAVMNNAKVPLAVACSLLVFGEQADVPRLTAASLALGLAVWLARR